MTNPRELALVFILLVPLGVLFAVVPAIPQDLSYHAFADNRTMFGVPNFLNVVSNVPFLIVGLMGLRLCTARDVAGAARSWTVFFFGVSLVAFGSGYYHWMPDSQTLAWDRLPMTIAFMALFAALVAEHVRAENERTLLRIALAVGILSVVWWRYTDDLRLYAWVQFGPLVALVFIVLAFPGRYTHRGYLMLGFTFYVLSKIAEYADGGIYSATGSVVSGHSLKHVLAAGAPYSVYLMLKKRTAVGAL